MVVWYEYNVKVDIYLLTTKYVSDCISECTSNADVFFVLDASGSVHYDNFNKMKDFVKALVGNLNVFDEESNVGILTFRYESCLIS